MHKIRASLRAAFPYTLPILTGFLFLGMTYGITVKSAGFPGWLPVLTSTLVFAGSAEFALAGLFAGPFLPFETFLMIFLINARHIFYGISLLEKYKNTGLKKLYMVFGMCDESFSVNYAAEVPPEADAGWFYFFVTLLNHLYWITGSALGAAAGMLFRFPTEGLDFVMTAMFAVIFLEQWLKGECRAGAAAGVLLTLGSLLLFGAEDFLLPAMLLILTFLALFRRPLEAGMQKKQEAER